MVAFADSLHKFGILLTTAEIRRQYDRYNQSQNQDGRRSGCWGSAGRDRAAGRCLAPTTPAADSPRPPNPSPEARTPTRDVG